MTAECREGRSLTRVPFGTAKARNALQLLPVIERVELVKELTSPPPRLLKLLAPAGYGKSTLARAVAQGLGRGLVIDLSYALTELDLYRSLVFSLSSLVSEREREAFGERSAMLGSDCDGWRGFAEEVFWSTRLDVLLLENAEDLLGVDPVLRAIERLLNGKRSRLHVIVCSRIEAGLRLGRFAGPDHTRLVGPDELRFSRNDIGRLFSDIALRRGDLEAIENFTGGWPIVVMMLYSIARRGGLSAYLQERHDVADLYGYLASEVYRFLTDGQRAVLEAAAAIPEARESDLAALFGGGDYLGALEVLERDTPFVTRVSGTQIHVHPAMRQMLAQRSDPDAILARLYEKLYRTEDGVRAAQIAIHRRRPADAAIAILDGVGPFIVETPRPEVNQIVGALPDEVIHGHPALWSAASLTRGNRDIVAWTAAGERLYRNLHATSPMVVRMGLFSALAQLYLNRGRFADAVTLIDGFLAQNQGDPLTGLLCSFWKTVICSYRGESVDLDRFQSEFAPLLSSAGTRALCYYDIIARAYRLCGHRDKERATLERSVEIARSSGIPVILGMCLNDAAFGAWLWGEDALFTRHVEALEELSANPVINPTFAHFIGCIKGRCARTPFGSEKLKTRAHGFLIAASISKTRGERLAFAQQAVLAADQSSQRYAQVISRVGLAVVDELERENHFAEARRIAAETCSEELLQAVLATERGETVGNMLLPLVRRFQSGPARRARAHIDIAAGSAAITGCSDALRPREAAVVAYIALLGRPARKDEILRALWPDHDSDAAGASLKTYVSRLRRISGDAEFIVLEAGRYRLGVPPVIVNSERANPTNWPWFDEFRRAANSGS